MKYISGILPVLPGRPGGNHKIIVKAAFWKSISHCATLVVFFIIPLIGQDKMLGISGRVNDKNDQPISFANIGLYQTSDSMLVTGDVTDAEGRFSIESPAGNYFLKISFLSYEEKIIPAIILTGQDIDIGIINLAQAASLLEEIVVEGERSTMNLQLDKRVFHVGKDLANISGSASDILNNVPSVNVDVEGNVSLRGSQNVRILIDGKPSGLTGISTADALQQVQASLIESVEVITNPSSRFDAEGEVGIINIVLKKEHRSGVNGSFMVNLGQPDHYGGTFSLNFRKENLNFFASYGYNYRESPGSGTSTVRFTFPDTLFSYSEETKRVRGGHSHNLIGGLDYYFTESSMLTASFVYRPAFGLNTSRILFRDLDGQNQLLRTVIRNEREEEPENSGEYSLSYRKSFKNPGQQFTTDIKWIENVEEEIASFEQIDERDGSLTRQRALNTENERNVFFQADYIHPFGEAGKLETGLRSTLRVIDNAFLVEEENLAQDWNIIPGFNNALVYSEKIFAGYAMMGNSWKRWSYQAGLRGELTDISVALKLANEDNRQQYFNVFPSLFTSYKLSETNTFQLSYSYRISRPRFRQLMPFSNYSNNRSLSTGNPYLRPEFTHSMEGSHLLNWTSGTLLSSIYYRGRRGVIEEITLVDSVGYDRRFPINLSSEQSIGFEFNLSWSPVQWLRYVSNVNLFSVNSEGTYQDQIFTRKALTWTNRSILQFSIRKNWDLQATFNYQAPQNTPQGKRLSLHSTDIAIARDLLKNQASIALSVRDLFNTRRFRREIVGTELNSYSEFQGRRRQLMLSFTYRLNQKKDNKNSEDSFDEDF